MAGFLVVVARRRANLAFGRTRSRLPDEFSEPKPPENFGRATRTVEVRDEPPFFPTTHSPRARTIPRFAYFALRIRRADGPQRQRC